MQRYAYQALSGFRFSEWNENEMEERKNFMKIHIGLLNRFWRGIVNGQARSLNVHLVTEIK